MIRTSQKYKEVISSPGRIFEAKFIINGITYTKKDLAKIDFIDGLGGSKQLPLGGGFMSSVTIKVRKIIENLEEMMPCTLEILVKLKSGENESIKLGSFFVTSIKLDRNSNYTELKICNEFCRLGGEYKSKLQLPTTSRKVLQEVVNLTGIHTVSTLTVANDSILDFPKSLTYRDAIIYIAQMNASFAAFNRDGKLDFVKLRQTEKHIPKDLYKPNGLVKGEILYRFRGIENKLQDKKMVISSGIMDGTELKIANPWMRKNILDRVFDAIRDLNYYPYTLTWNGDPSLEPGDWITVTWGDNKEVHVPIFDQRISFDGGISSSCSASGSTKSEAVYKYKGSIQKRLEYVEELATSQGIMYMDTEEPNEPKNGDIWFKPSGGYVELWEYQDDKWTKKADTADIGTIVNTITTDEVLAKKLSVAIANVIELNAKSINSGDINLQRLRIMNGGNEVLAVRDGKLVINFGDTIATKKDLDKSRIKSAIVEKAINYSTTNPPTSGWTKDFISPRDNMLPNGDFTYGMQQWTPYTDTGTYVYIDKYQKNACLRIEGAKNGIAYAGQHIKVHKGDVITISARAAATNVTKYDNALINPIQIDAEDTDGNWYGGYSIGESVLPTISGNNLTNYTWFKRTVGFAKDLKNNELFLRAYVRNCTGSLYVDCIKIEKGTERTTFKPHPDDANYMTYPLYTWRRERITYTDGTTTITEPELILNENEIEAVRSKVQQTANNIELAVTKGNIVSSVNLSTEGVKIKGDKIQIGTWEIKGKYFQSTDEVVGINCNSGASNDQSAFWAGYDNKKQTYNFRVTHGGILKCKGAEISGYINAESGWIGNWKITKDYLQSSNGAVGVGVGASSGGTSAFWAGYSSSNNSYKFRVTHSGDLTCNSVKTLKGGSYSGSSYGYGSFSSGSYSGSGYLSGGSTLAGWGVNDSDDGLKITKINTNRLRAGRIVVDELYVDGMNFGGYAISRGGNGNLTWSSDIREKENIVNINDEFLEDIYNLKIIDYNYKSNKDRRVVGVNANLVNKTASRKFVDRFIFYNNITKRYGVSYTALVPMLITVVQNLNERLKKLEA